MMMDLSANTKIHELLKAYPFLEDFLARYNPKFEKLKSPVLRATVGRIASLKMAASIGEVDLSRLLADLAAEIERQAGEKVGIDVATPSGAEMRSERIEVLKGIIQDLHDGGDLASARERFALAVKDVAASEIAEMEQQLIREGMPVEEVQRLCDVHVGAFREALDEHPAVETPPGHPVHTYMAENRKIERFLNRLAKTVRELEQGGGLPDRETPFHEVLESLIPLEGLDNHYTRKENQLFPLLEKHGVEGPSKVMWGVHDEIRALAKKVRSAAASGKGSEMQSLAPEFIRVVSEMIYKEEKILFPMSLDTLSEEEWIEVRRGEDELGYAFAKPGTDWPATSVVKGESPMKESGKLDLNTGQLSSEQIDLILTHLPVDISFVDENDVVRYYSGGERHFPRTPAVIGRKVQNCHPPKSVDIVERIVKAFKDGTRDAAAFWIQHHGKFLHIRYFAIRDTQGRYRGCLEVGQDITEIKELEGEQRLLDWNAGP
ncbi:MAG: DUF438 domain-containing protein [Planctomycetota bacterium]|jgi:DUF438 domain-containing protein